VAHAPSRIAAGTLDLEGTARHTARRRRGTRETEEHAVDMDRLDERGEEQFKEPVRGPSEEHRDADSQAAQVWWEISASHTHTAT
jgi:hypothetical protein